MERSEIFKQIEGERVYQDSKWGKDFDDKNTPNDWVAYLSKYLGKSVASFAGDKANFREGILKVATLCVAILERDKYAPRHYDR
jgi:hypothetical protein